MRVASMNRLANCRNPYQGKSKRVLCVCSAGLLRSPTAALMLAVNYGYNTRAAGLDEAFALIPVDDALLTWADEVVCMSQVQAAEIETRVKELDLDIPVWALDIPDRYAYMDVRLQALIVESYRRVTGNEPHKNVPSRFQQEPE